MFAGHREIARFADGLFVNGPVSGRNAIRSLIDEVLADVVME